MLSEGKPGSKRREFYHRLAVNEKMHLLADSVSQFIFNSSPILKTTNLSFASGYLQFIFPDASAFLLKLLFTINLQNSPNSRYAHLLSA